MAYEMILGKALMIVGEQFLEVVVVLFEEKKLFENAEILLVVGVFFCDVNGVILVLDGGDQMREQKVEGIEHLSDGLRLVENQVLPN